MSSRTHRSHALTSAISTITGLLTVGLGLCAAPAVASAQTQLNTGFIDSGGESHLARVYRPSPAQLPSGYHPPAVVMMHGCSGMWSGGNRPQALLWNGIWMVDQGPVAQSHIEKWGRKLAEEGYYAMAIDGYSLRTDGSQNHCNESPPYVSPKVDPYTTRAGDFLAARDFLVDSYDVSLTGVGELGWSQGAQTTLVNVAETPRTSDVAYCAHGAFACSFRALTRPAAAVVFYPGCGSNLGYGYSSSSPGYWRPDVSVRWNHGDADGTVPFESCGERIDNALTTYLADIDLDLYESVGHSFDQNDPPGLYTFPTTKCTPQETASEPTRCARQDADIDSLTFILSEVQGY